MAETVGVIAAALQLAELALELKQLYSSAKHAPENLQQLLEELETLEEVLQTLAEQEATISAYASATVTQKCRLQCEKALKRLKPVCDELSRGIKRSRICGSIKSISRDDFLEKAKLEIERAKTSLGLAQQALLIGLTCSGLQLANQQHSHTQTLIVATPTRVCSLLEDSRQIPQTQPAQALLTMSADMSTKPEPIDFGVNRKSNRRVSKTNTRRLLLQSRWIGKRIEFFHEQAHSGWDFRFRIYNIRQSSRGFDCAWEGDVASLQQLFETRQASIYDRDEIGWTLLHWAALSCQGSMIRFLKQEGVDPGARTDKNSSCLDLLLVKHPNVFQMADDPFNELTKDCLPEDLYDDPVQSVICLAIYTPNLLPRWIPMMITPWNTLELASRLDAAFSIIRSCRTVATQFWLCLSQSYFDPACLVRKVSAPSEPDQCQSLVQNLAARMSRFWDNDPNPQDFSGWRSVLDAAVRAGGLRAGFEHECGSPMLTYLRLDRGWYDGSTADLSSRRLTHRLRHWVQEILNAGQDLEKYGRWEYERLSDSYAINIRVEEHKVHIIKLIYGKKPQDWQIWVSTSMDESTGEFWESLQVDDKDTPLDLPGAWPETTSTESPGYWGERRRHRRSRRKRRRWLRYFSLTKADEDEEFSKGLYGTWKDAAVEAAKSGKQGKARRAQFFNEAGITPPY